MARGGGRRKPPTAPIGRCRGGFRNHWSKVGAALSRMEMRLVNRDENAITWQISVSRQLRRFFGLHSAVSCGRVNADPTPFWRRWKVERARTSFSQHHRCGGGGGGLRPFVPHLEHFPRAPLVHVYGHLVQCGCRRGRFGDGKREREERIV